MVAATDPRVYDHQPPQNSNDAPDWGPTKDVSHRQLGTMVLVHVSTWKLLLTMAPLLLIVAISAHLSLRLERAIVSGAIRTLVQLSLLGIILEPIFVRGETMPWLVVAYCALMVLLAAYESVHRSHYTFPGMWLCVLGSLAVNVALVSLFAFGVILQPTPRWDPHYVIPIVGMLLGNSINGISLSLNELLTSLVEQAHEIEIYLSWAATPREATARLLREAVRVGAMPQLNSMAIIGLISIPGMMTGQILGGSPVREAAQYQMLIMYLIALCTFGTILTEIIMALQAGFDGAYRLRTDRLVPTQSGRGLGGDTYTSHTSSGGGSHPNRHDTGSWLSRLCHWLCCCCCRSTKPTPVIHRGNGTASLETPPQGSLSSKETTPLIIPPAPPIHNTNIFDIDPETEENTHNSIHVRTLYTAPPERHSDTVISSNGNIQSRRRSFRLEIENLTHAFVHSPAYGTRSSTIANNHDNRMFGHYDDNHRRRRMLFHRFSLDVQPGQILLVGGPSGVGKSTLLRLIAGLAAPEDRSPTSAIRLHVTNHEPHDNHHDSTTTTSALPFRLSLRRTSSMSQVSGLYQPHRDRTLWRLHVRHVAQHRVVMPGTPRDFLRTVSSFQTWQQHVQHGNRTIHRSSTAMESTTAELVQSWGMDATVCLDRPWSTLSGGESQRVMLAMALASQPHILLLDESTASLDTQSKLKVEHTILAYCRDTHMSVLWVTHDPEQVERLSSYSNNGME